MKLAGPACTKALSEAEEAERRERAEDSAGGVRVERRVRPTVCFANDFNTIMDGEKAEQLFEALMFFNLGNDPFELIFIE